VLPVSAQLAKELGKLDSKGGKNPRCERDGGKKIRIRGKGNIGETESRGCKCISSNIKVCSGRSSKRREGHVLRRGYFKKVDKSLAGKRRKEKGSCQIA